MLPTFEKHLKLGIAAVAACGLVGCSVIEKDENELPQPTLASHEENRASCALPASNSPVVQPSQTTVEPLTQKRKKKTKKPSAAVLKQEKQGKMSGDELVLLAEKYYNGIGETRDVAKGLSYFVQAANAGNGYACRRLGMEYSDFAFDDKTPRDDKKARAWFEKGAALGDAESLFYLSQFVFEGRGGPKDERRATSLLVQAAQNRSQLAAHRALKLNKKGVVTLSNEDKWKFYKLDRDLHDNIALKN